MLFAIEKQISKRNSSLLQTSNHEFRLVGRNNLVLRSLKEDYRHRQAINVINRRTIDISLMFVGIRSDQPIQLMRLEFVRIARERNKVTHPVIACSRAKRNLMLRGQGAQRGITASAATANHQTVGVGVPIRH
jgi:hypothetical protein